VLSFQRLDVYRYAVKPCVRSARADRGDVDETVSVRVEHVAVAVHVHDHVYDDGYGGYVVREAAE